MKKTIYIFFILFTANNFVRAQPGSLDLSFGSGGIVTTDFFSDTDVGYSMAIQSDGKIVVAGEALISSDHVFALTRFNVDGSLDTTFDFDGKVSMHVGMEDNTCRAVKVQADGKIVVAGCIQNGINFDLSLIRYNSDGSIDSTFDSDGIVITEFGSANSSAYSLIIQMDGKIIAGGVKNDSSGINFAMARYNVDGSLDTTFSVDGMAITDFGSGYAYVASVNLQSDGKIVLVGSRDNGIDYDFACARYNSDGNLDSTFGTDGKVTTDFVGGNDYATSSSVQLDGKIVIAGTGGATFELLRFNNDGSLDTSFDSDGKIITNLGVSFNGANALTLQTDGKIVVGGYHWDTFSDQDFTVIRYNGDGTLDNSFDGDGIDTTDCFTCYGDCFSIALQSDGKIVCAGLINSDFGVIRYNVAPLTIQEKTFSNIPNLFPNPTTGKINLELKQSPNKASIKIIDLTGQAILSQQNMSGNYFTFDVSNYSTGLYFLEVEENGSFERIKFMKD